jgi:hypothetical protein
VYVSVLRVVGGLFILLGILSGIVLVMIPLGLTISGSVTTFWLLFLFCVIGGLVLYSLGTQDSPVSKVLKVTGGLILILGVVSAFVIFLSKVQVVEADASFSLWALFIVGTIGGVSSILTAEEADDVSSRQIRTRAAMYRLEKRFDNHMTSIWKNFSDIASSIRSYGGLVAARRMLHQDAAPEFNRLKDRDQLKWSVEATILQAEWFPLFTDLERRFARDRLEAAGYEQAPAKN